MVIADMMDIKNILKDFSRLAEARKNHTFRTRLVFIFCAATIAMVLFFSYRVVNSAMDKILVVNEGGELLRFKAMQQDLLYESLLKNHCYHTAYYLNSFDRLSLQENRARALFLVNKPDANTIFAKYQADRGTATPWNSEWSTGRSSRRCSRYPSAGTSITSPSRQS